MQKSKKLLLIGGSKGNVHLLNFHGLVASYFQETCIVSNQEMEQSNVKVLNFELKNPFAMLKNVRKLRAIIREFDPDVIHVHQANAYGFITGLANRGKKPLVVTTWGSDVLTLPKRSMLHKWMVQYVLRSAVEITADAQFMADAIHGLIGPSPVVVANFGVEIQTMQASASREKIIYSNRMHEPLYRIDEIITQSTPFLLANPTWKLRIAASGSETERLKQLAKQHLPETSVEFVGFQSAPENRANYLSSTIYVSIPNTDGTSISLLEAMAYGCLPIVSDLPANREWIEHGVNGLISTGNLSEDLTNALKMNSQSMQEVNTKIIEEKATKKANKQKFEAIYDRIFA